MRRIQALLLGLLSLAFANPSPLRSPLEKRHKWSCADRCERHYCFPICDSKGPRAPRAVFGHRLKLVELVLEEKEAEAILGERAGRDMINALKMEIRPVA